MYLEIKFRVVEYIQSFANVSIFKTCIFLMNTGDVWKIECAVGKRKVSLSVMGWNTNWNNCWRIKGSQKEQNQYCWRWIFLFWTWAKGFRVPKRSVDAALPEELWSHRWHYAHFLLQNPLRVMLKTYLEEKIYREGDMDILLNALTNAYYCKFILHQ